MRVSHNFREIPHCARMRGDDADIASGPPIGGVLCTKEGKKKFKTAGPRRGSNQDSFYNQLLFARYLPRILQLLCMHD